MRSMYFSHTFSVQVNARMLSVHAWKGFFFNAAIHINPPVIRVVPSRAHQAPPPQLPTMEVEGRKALDTLDTNLESLILPGARGVRTGLRPAGAIVSQARTAHGSVRVSTPILRRDVVDGACR